ncbi:MAG TPA: LpqN/LpqT family lipoprotein [Mycobacterium sp.]|jgi:hypothetical protein|nr:LpqN/LpqT family lipoprotein [Mycobacterium sp.]MCB9417059.1 LpqN/LpqT family lipoprotein [Mycolicibacterium sp.]TXI53426.1 MAG: hypothetical protein E6Q57_03585 [Mycobacterium sp.]HRD12173.1 LpqN/LpqT family lipoprotein [Mycobacterium sp.]
MKNIAAVATVGLATVSMSLVLVGCSSATKTDKPATSTSASASTSTSAAPSTSAAASGAAKTINDYITENNIAETPIKPDEPGTPNFDFPFPPGWSLAGDKTPDWAYGAIVYDKPEDPKDPPAIIAIASKLTGDVDPAKILQYAPNQLLNLPDFKPIGEPENVKMSGFDANQSAGTYTDDGIARVVAQKTIVIPGKDALFVLQLNADARQSEENVVIDAAKLIDEQTKITA